jgi:hypothetical protein
MLTRGDLQRQINRLKEENQQLQARLDDIADIVNEDEDNEPVNSYEED